MLYEFCYKLFKMIMIYVFDKDDNPICYYLNFSLNQLLINFFESNFFILLPISSFFLFPEWTSALIWFDQGCWTTRFVLTVSLSNRNMQKAWCKSLWKIFFLNCLKIQLKSKMYRSSKVKLKFNTLVNFEIFKPLNKSVAS